MRTQRRLRRKAMLAARRQRAIQRRTARLERASQRQQWMQMVMHDYCAKILRERKTWALARTSDWWENTAPNLTEEEWLEKFRVSRDTFRYICATLKPALQRQDTSFRLCLTLEKRIAIALHKLTSTADYKTVGNLFAVGCSTVCQTLQKFCQAVMTLLRPQLIPMPSQAKLAQMADYFEESFSIPQCVGAINVLHIPILKPPEDPADFCNRDGWHSIILQAVVDGKGMFWDINIGQPGSKDQESVLKMSAIWALASTTNVFSDRIRNICGTDVGYFILGDWTYPLQKWLLKPYAHTGWLTEAQEMYNVRTNGAHTVVGRAIGRLKGRWKCLSKRSDFSVRMVVDIVETCCTLHNLCELRMERFLPEWEDAHEVKFNGISWEGEEWSEERNALEQLFMQQQYNSSSFA
ncbi:hypothetical protein ACEWY4_002012 [Coilia grayii]|uniref:DDE Tnp4 domain-containing protein n=1 Tax=Coilia grayii TaxID=363190 RepID=A0ABD1KUK7_9TELE